jgi:membrane associated rhomboid family serine protease
VVILPEECAISLFHTNRDTTPAVVLGFWIVVQFVNGLVTFGAGEDGLGGVAWFAHLGGFAAGLGLLYLLRPRPLARL